MRIEVSRQNIYPKGCITTTWSVDEEGMVKGDEELLMLIALTNLLSGKVKSSYSVCSLVVPTLEEAILTSVLKKNFK